MNGPDTIGPDNIGPDTIDDSAGHDLGDSASHSAGDNVQTPAIRFKGFNAPWEEKALGDVCDVRDGTHESPKYVPSGYPLITSKNVKNGYINYNEIQYISQKDYDDINKRSKVDINDILMGMIGTIGNIALIREPVNFAIKNVALIKDNNLVSYLYVYTFLQSPITAYQLYEGMDGGTQKFISLNRVRKLTLVFPQCASEQTKIGNLFQRLDRLIVLHQQKHDKLCHVKKALLEKMFPKQGRDTPDIRFKGFSDPWEERALEEIGSFKSGVGFPEAEQNGKLGIPYYKVSDMNLDGNQQVMAFANNYVNEEQIERLGYKLINEKSIIFAKVGAAIFLERKRIASNFLIDNNMMSFSTTEDVVFIKLWFDTIKLSKYVQVGALPSYNASDLNIIELCVPTKLEQTKIGNLFQRLDTLINQHQSQIKKLGHIKQACLAKMFV